MDLDTSGATYVYNEHPDNIVYLETGDVMSTRALAFTITEDADLEVDVTAGNFKFLVDGYISDSAGSYNYGIKSAPAQGSLRLDYPQRIYEFASLTKFEEYLAANGYIKMLPMEINCILSLMNLCQTGYLLNIKHFQYELIF